MKDLRKDEQLNIRIRGRVKRRIERAARIESRNRQEIVESGPLVVELALPGIERILRSAKRPALATAVNQ